ncbi:TonB-dependent receptor [Flavobacteriaceae bacterium F89]|uniref:TonB-dependent receptor n=1 Tax=Cerina litoralis TaxID=2874477 RepID=A0AAE3ETD8_9FLAO|nr:TonB-dependent receptor [Cerina litoralis]MCG2460135.1 TonB-dependent receptor [Cerina litoralis]
MPLRRSCIFVLLGVLFQSIFAQEASTVTGTVLDRHTTVVPPRVTIAIEGTTISKLIDTDGKFKLVVPLIGEYVLNIAAPDYIVKRLPLGLESKELDLGPIFLEKDIAMESSENLLILSEEDISDEESVSLATGILQATRDVFLNRAAFDFSQAFFRVRGYDSENGMVLINGIPMNKLMDGRPQWNNWGGLNDVTRNQEFTFGLQASDYNFSGVLGSTNIDTRPTGLRPGVRLSASASNRTYAGRFMATYNSGTLKNRFAYSLSGSGRWAKEGYLDGTLYDSYSLYGALEYQINPKNSLLLTAIFASNRRGRSSAITEEVYNLVGNKYNPYWGEQDGKIRNSRERKIQEPIAMLNYLHASEKFALNTGVSYQFGTYAKSRLGYYHAPSPDPTYYRYLPSFYINSPIGANFISANMARQGFLANPQLNWNRLYTANFSPTIQGKAAYVLYDDTTDDRQLNANSIGNLSISEHFKMDFGITYNKLTSDNYAQLEDLLGAEYHEDIDPFSDTKNDLDGTVQKGEGDIFNYHYEIEADALETFVQLQVMFNKWDGFISAGYSKKSYQRDGLYRNERFLDDSFGYGEKLHFSNFGIKGGATYRITGRHFLAIQGAYLNRAPVVQNAYVNPRENNRVVPNLQSEKITTVDLNYYVRLPALMGRVSGFYTRFQNTTDINFFFVDAGVGSDFVQEVVTDLDKLHMGIEIGLEYQISAAVKLSTVASIGKYVYASNPFVSINFDTAGAEEDLINPDGNVNLGISKIKDYKLAQGPQQAYALGLEYRDPKYWWVGMTVNYLANNYASISPILRTQSFYLDPGTGKPFPNATTENVEVLLAQKRLDDFYLLNLIGGKSWLIDGKYIGVFASVNNMFDTVFRTGGYEQSRNGNFGQMAQDNLSGTPSFAPKYWYGYGRTYFLNLAVSF